VYAVAQPELSDAGLVLGLGGLVIGVIGANEIRASTNALHRAIWWHNRDLPR
jgi:hypothetical protein